MDTETTPLIQPDEQFPEERKPRAFKDLIFIVWPLAIGEFLAAIDATIVLSAYASIGTDLNALQSTSWIATAYLLTSTSFMPLYGKLTNIFGAKECLLFAYAVFGIATWFCGLARNMTELTIARAVAGIGGAGVFPPRSTAIPRNLARKAFGSAKRAVLIVYGHLGFINIIFSVGQATGGPLGGILSDSVGWRWAFYFQVPIAALAFVSLYFFLPGQKTEVQVRSNLLSKIKRVDFLGSAIIVCSVLCLLLGLELGTNSSFADPVVIALLVGACISTICFLFVEAKVSSEPLAPMHIITNKDLLLLYICNFFASGAWMSMSFNISLYYQAVRKQSAGEAGLGLLPGVVASVSGSLFAGIVMQKTGKYYTLTVISYICMAMGSLLVCATTGLIGHSLVGNYIGLAVTFFGSGSGVTSTLIALIAIASSEDQAVVIAVSYLFRYLGMVISLSLSTTLVQGTLRSSLKARLPADGTDIAELVRRIRESLDYVDQLSPGTRAVVWSSYEEALMVAFTFLTISSCLPAFCSIFFKEKPIDRK